MKAEKGKVDKEKKIANCGPHISAHALPLDGGLVFFFFFFFEKIIYLLRK